MKLFSLGRDPDNSVDKPMIGIISDLKILIKIKIFIILL